MVTSSDVSAIMYRIKANRKIKGYSATIRVMSVNGGFDDLERDFPCGKYSEVISAIRDIRDDIRTKNGGVEIPFVPWVEKPYS